MSVVEQTIKAAWEGRISGCLLGKPVEIISMREGREGLSKYLSESGSLPLRNYVRPMEHAMIRGANDKRGKQKMLFRHDGKGRS